MTRTCRSEHRRAIAPCHLARAADAGMLRFPSTDLLSCLSVVADRRFRQVAGSLPECSRTRASGARVA